MSSNSLLGLSKDELLELEEEVERLVALRNENLIESFFPETGLKSRHNYPKVMDFFAAGSDHKFRLLMAGNRVGKTIAGAYELTCHLTGIYPHWWKGRRYLSNSNWWVCGVDSKIILTVLQPLLIGQLGAFGTGMIPKKYLDFDTIKDVRSITTPINRFRVWHVNGTWSSVEFKSYESGRDSFQSFNGCIWLDEECPMPIFQECVMRTTHTQGEQPCMIITFTPLKGSTKLIKTFFEGKALTTTGTVGVSKYVQRASLETDAPHIPASEKAIIIANTPPWARDARIHGIPQHGAGAIYPIEWKNISVPRFEIPKHWKRYAGMDVGGKTAAIWFAINPDTGVHYGYHEYYREGELPSVHVQGISPPGKWIPIAIDSAAHGRSQIDGQNLFSIYEDLGLTLYNANKAVEAGLYTCWERMVNGTVKIFADLKRFEEEFLAYHKDEQGRIVKVDDHMMDAFRYAIMSGPELATTELAIKAVVKPSGYVSQQYRVQPVVRRR
jgi:phage terminase large subunit-like protein